jgi:cupin fold WbuC family metalloprotein
MEPRKVGTAQLDALAAQAAAAPRGRAHLQLHTGHDDPVQRFFVAADPRSYFRPHRHNTKSELALVVRGRFDVLVFDEAGTVQARHAIAAAGPDISYEMPARTWHTLLSTADGSTFLEVKQGPYDPATAVEFPAWAPPEGAAAAGRFLDWLRNAQPGDHAPTI